MAEKPHGATRRDFLYVAAGGMTAIGAAAFVWPFVSQMNPSKDVLALSSIEVDVSQVPEGGAITVSWRGKPVFIRHRTAKEIEAARADDAGALPDPQKDADRVKQGKEAWLVLVGVCTHLGCVPLNNQGEYGGWFCPCHGSHYDTSGRIRKGPAPTNLEVPSYAFVNDTTVRIG